MPETVTKYAIQRKNKNGEWVKHTHNHKVSKFPVTKSSGEQWIANRRAAKDKTEYRLVRIDETITVVF